MIINSSDVTLISKHLQDDISRNIYGNRLLYALTGNIGYLRNVCMTIPEVVSFVDWIDKHKKRERILFGAGQWGNWIRETFDNINWDFFADNNSDNKVIHGIPVLSPEELVSSHMDSTVIITSKYHWQEIYEQLVDKGFDDELIYCLGKTIVDIESRIYFDLPELPNASHEVFVDAGGYDGQTSFGFAKWASVSENIKITVFEPEPEFQKKCHKTLENISNVTVVPKGLWDKDDVLLFDINGSESKIVEASDNAVKIPVTTIDGILKGDDVTFIKMDIEGSELAALKGGVKTIKQYKPKLAISIYHNSEDLIEIPKLLLKLNPQYKFWLRHYSMAWFDTILYAF